MAERLDHDAMRRAAELPISGPAATNTLAASGGLELPGREPHPTDAASPADAPEPIPGEHDRTTEQPTQPAIVGTTGFGSDVPASEVDPTLDDELRKQVRWEAGGKTD
jgi:hypothetical protein